VYDRSKAFVKENIHARGRASRDGARTGSEGHGLIEAQLGYDLDGVRS